MLECDIYFISILSSVKKWLGDSQKGLGQIRPRLATKKKTFIFSWRFKMFYSADIKITQNDFFFLPNVFDVGSLKKMWLPTLSDCWIFMVWYILGCRVQKMFALEYIGKLGIVRLQQTSCLLSSFQEWKVLAAQGKGARGHQ